MKIPNRIRNKVIAPVSASHSHADAGPASGRSKSRSKRGWIFNRCIADQEGSTVVETALVMSFILVPTLLVIFSTCMALYTYQRVGYAAFAAAQTLGASRGILTDPCHQIVTSTATVSPGFPPTNFTYTVWITQQVNGLTSTQKYGPTTGPTFTCSGTAAGQGGYALNNAYLQPIVVQIGYSYNWFPVFGKAIAGVLMLRQSVLVS